MDTLRSLEWGGRPVVVEVLGWDEAFVAADRSPVEGVGGGPSQQHRPPSPTSATRGLRPADPGRGAGGDPAALLGRDRQQQAPGQDRHRLRQARPGDLRDHRRDLVRGDGRTGRPGRCGGSGRRSRSGWRRSASTPSSSSPLRRPAARRRVRPDDGAVVPPARPRRRHQPGRRDAVGAAGARPRGDVPGGPHRLGRRRGGDPPDHPPGGGRHRPRGPAGVPGRAEDPLPAVRHPHPDPQDRRSPPTTPRCSPTRRSRCSTGSRSASRSGCSASGWRWSSPRAATTHPAYRRAAARPQLLHHRVDHRHQVAVGRGGHPPLPLVRRPARRDLGDRAPARQSSRAARPPAPAAPARRAGRR